MTLPTSDLWVHGNYAYTGTWAVRGPGLGNTLFVWDISTPAAPSRTDSVKIDAITVKRREGQGGWGDRGDHP